eukprot:2929903-Pyramimonas_sp.AAC.1
MAACFNYVGWGTQGGGRPERCSGAGGAQSAGAVRQVEDALQRRLAPFAGSERFRMLVERGDSRVARALSEA